MAEAFANRYLHCNTDPGLTTVLHYIETNYNARVKLTDAKRIERMKFVSETYLAPYLAWCMDKYFAVGDNDYGTFTFDTTSDMQFEFSKECDVYAVLSLACLSHIYNVINADMLSQIISGLYMGFQAGVEPNVVQGAGAAPDEEYIVEEIKIPPYIGNVASKDLLEGACLMPPAVGGRNTGSWLSAALALASAAAAALLLVVTA